MSEEFCQVNFFNFLLKILSVILFLYRNIKAALDKREKRTTMTLFMICFCYFLFVMPIALVNIIDDTHFSPQLHLALFCVYWLQYSLNFFIYAGRSEQYRKAYWYFLRKVSSVFKDWGNPHVRRSKNWIFLHERQSLEWRKINSPWVTNGDGEF